MENLKISALWTPESLRNEEEDPQGHDIEILECTGCTLDEWKARIVGKPLLDLPKLPIGWAAWSGVTKKGEVGVFLSPVLGPLGNRLTQVLIDLQAYFQDKLPDDLKTMKKEVKSFSIRRFKEMCCERLDLPCPTGQ